MKLLMIFVGIFILILGAGRIWARAAKPPHLGVKNGLLSILPDTPNCVSTQDGSSEQRMAPMPYSGSQSDAQQKLLGIITKLSRCAIQEEKPGYIWVVYRSMVFGFPDDVEFLFDDEKKVIHFRAAARLGYFDMVVNRKRMEKISMQFEKS